MLKQLVTFILLISFATQTFNKVFIVIDYNINTSSFAAHCENKAKPILKCNGKCQMMKALKEEDKKDQQYPDRRGDNKNEIVLSCQTCFYNVISPEALANNHNYLQINDRRIVKRQKGIFHPPNNFIA